MKDLLKKIVTERTKSKVKLSDSIASIEEKIFKAEQEGNTRQTKALKAILKRLKSKRAT